jgi:hypothetical protein
MSMHYQTIPKVLVRSIRESYIPISNYLAKVKAKCNAFFMIGKYTKQNTITTPMTTSSHQLSTKASKSLSELTTPRPSKAPSTCKPAFVIKTMFHQDSGTGGRGCKEMHKGDVWKYPQILGIFGKWGTGERHI